MIHPFLMDLSTRISENLHQFTDAPSHPERARWLEAGGWRLEAGGWRLEAGGWRLEAGGWRASFINVY